MRSLINTQRSSQLSQRLKNSSHRSLARTLMPNQMTITRLGYCRRRLIRRTVIGVTVSQSSTKRQQSMATKMHAIRLRPSDNSCLRRKCSWMKWRKVNKGCLDQLQRGSFLDRIQQVDQSGKTRPKRRRKHRGPSVLCFLHLKLSHTPLWTARSSRWTRTAYWMTER